MLVVSEYIRYSSDDLRSKIVSHDVVKKKLVVVEENSNASEESPKQREKDWEVSGYFDNILEQIKMNTQEGVVDTLLANFTSTTPFERMFSVATIMDSFQNYFSYGRMVYACGINNVRFLGTLDDWQKLRNKTESLLQFVQEKKKSEDFLKRYVNRLLPILDQFVATYQGNVDVSFGTPS